MDHANENENDIFIYIDVLILVMKASDNSTRFVRQPPSHSAYAHKPAGSRCVLVACW